jgi:hypothetical protein
MILATTEVVLALANLAGKPRGVRCRHGAGECGTYGVEACAEFRDVLFCVELGGERLLRARHSEYDQDHAGEK